MNYRPLKDKIFAFYGNIFLPPRHQDTKEFQDYSNKVPSGCLCVLVAMVDKIGLPEANQKYSIYNLQFRFIRVRDNC
jgi:hypothetical protein